MIPLLIDKLPVCKNRTWLGTDVLLAGAKIGEWNRLRGKDPPLCVS